MGKKRKYLTRFFLTYFSIVIPVLLASIFATDLIWKEMEKIEAKTLQQQLEDAEAAFWRTWQEYYEESALIAGKTELLPQKMQGHPSDIRDGIEILKMKKSFDSTIHSVFVAYNGQHVYSSTGMARKHVYFNTVLGCDQESAGRGIALVESEENGITVLNIGNKDGLILYSYKFYRRENPLTAVNFALPFSQLSHIFPLSGPNQYYELQIADGSSLIIGTDGNGDFCVIDTDYWSRGEVPGVYSALDGIRSDHGVHIRLYYDRKSISGGKWLYQAQKINIVLILLGITLSTLMSWLLGRRQAREIGILEGVAKGKSDAFLLERSAYHDLQDLILQGFSENQKLEESVTQQREQLQRRIAHMILAGIFREPERLDAAFREMGLSEVPERFFAGAARLEGNCPATCITEVLGTPLWARIEQPGVQTFVFLCCCQDEDKGQLFRQKTAFEIRERLRQRNIRKASMGISRVYANEILISCACQEAVRLLDIPEAKRQNFCICQEDAPKKSGVLFEESLLCGFDNALAQEDYEEAVRGFRRLLYAGTEKECSPGNVLFLRYVILQHISAFLQKGEHVEKELLLQECLNIDPQQEREFTDAVLSLLQKCLIKRDDDRFTRILEFVNQNYQNSGLTYEETAGNLK